MASTAFGLAFADRNVWPTVTVPLGIHPDATAYNCYLSTGATTALSAGDTLLSLRTGTKPVFMQTILVCATQTTSSGAASASRIACYQARSFTASDTGGTAATLTGNQCKVRTADPSSTLADLRVAGTASLTPGTRTVAAFPMQELLAAHSVTLQAALANNNAIYSGSNPPLLAVNEGFIVTTDDTFPATSAITFRFLLSWAEVPTNF